MREAVAAFAEQVDVLADWLDTLADADFDRPSVLAGWDVRTLLGHVVMMRRGPGAGARHPLGPGAGAGGRLCAALPPGRRDDRRASTAATTGSRAPSELIASLREPLALDEVADRAVLVGPRGPITARDWIATRVVDLVVHCDDFSRSLRVPRAGAVAPAGARRGGALAR